MHSDVLNDPSPARSIKRLPIVLLLIADFVLYIPNFPEMGFETRPPSMVSPAMMAVYMVAIFLPLVAIPVLFKWPRVAGWMALLCGVLNIIPSALDIARVLFPAPPPTVIAVDEVVLIVVGAALCKVGYELTTS